MERERSRTCVAVSDLLIQHQTKVVELVKTALASLGNSENQPAIDAFKGAAVQDVTGATATFEVQTLSADDSGDLGIRSCWFSLGA